MCKKNIKVTDTYIFRKQFLLNSLNYFVDNSNIISIRNEKKNREKKPRKIEQIFFVIKENEK